MGTIICNSLLLLFYFYHFCLDLLIKFSLENLFTVVEVALTRSLYEVQESSDPLVCVKLSNGSLETTVYVLAITINGTGISFF